MKNVKASLEEHQVLIYFLCIASGALLGIIVSGSASVEQQSIPLWPWCYLRPSCKHRSLRLESRCATCGSLGASRDQFRRRIPVRLLRIGAITSKRSNASLSGSARPSNALHRLRGSHLLILGRGTLPTLAMTPILLVFADSIVARLPGKLILR